MSATGYLDACGFIPASSGTGNFVVSSAITGYQTPASAGAVNSTVYSYRAESADKTQWEEGFGAYTVSTATLARTMITANSSGGSTAINFSAAPNVFIVAASADLQNASLLTSGTLAAARITFATKSDQTTATSTTVLVNPGVQQYHPSAAKAWVILTGSTGAILDSYNVSGVVRNGTGDYTVSFTNAFSSAHYTYAEGIGGSLPGFVRNPSQLAGSFQAQVVNSANTTQFDPSTLSLTFFGTQ